MGDAPSSDTEGAKKSREEGRHPPDVRPSSVFGSGDLSPLVKGWATWFAVTVLVLGPKAILLGLYLHGDRDAWPLQFADRVGLLPLMRLVGEVGATLRGYIALFFGGLGAIGSMLARKSRLLQRHRSAMELYLCGVGYPFIAGLVSAVVCALIAGLFGWYTLETVPLAAAISLPIGFGERLLDDGRRLLR